MPSCPSPFDLSTMTVRLLDWLAQPMAAADSGWLFAAAAVGWAIGLVWDRNRQGVTS